MSDKDGVCVISFAVEGKEARLDPLMRWVMGMKRSQRQEELPISVLYPESPERVHGWMCLQITILNRQKTVTDCRSGILILH